MNHINRGDAELTRLAAVGYLFFALACSNAKLTTAERHVICFIRMSAHGGHVELAMTSLEHPESAEGFFIGYGSPCRAICARQGLFLFHSM